MLNDELPQPYADPAIRHLPEGELSAICDMLESDTERSSISYAPHKIQYNQLVPNSTTVYDLLLIFSKLLDSVAMELDIFRLITYVGGRRSILPFGAKAAEVEVIWQAKRARRAKRAVYLMKPKRSAIVYIDGNSLFSISHHRIELPK